MSRYEPLAHFLDKRSEPIWQAKFADVERVLGSVLPPSAYRHPAWWANQQSRGHSQVSGWRSVGWRTTKLDLEGKSVVFEKETASHPCRVSAEDIWARAAKATGISDRGQLAVEGLKALLARDAAQRLIRLGGTMPELSVPARERPNR